LQAEIIKRNDQNITPWTQTMELYQTTAHLLDPKFLQQTKYLLTCFVSQINKKVQLSESFSSQKSYTTLIFNPSEFFNWFSSQSSSIPLNLTEKTFTQEEGDL
jgi:pullulanase/glycogen debranching enzyme